MNAVLALLHARLLRPRLVAALADTAELTVQYLRQPESGADGARRLAQAWSAYADLLDAAVQVTTEHPVVGRVLGIHPWPGPADTSAVRANAAALRERGGA